jgi:hypothetical protein
VKAPVTHKSCGAFVVYGASVAIPNSPAFHPSNPAKTETVPVPNDGKPRESMWTNGREDVSRSEAKRVFRARAGRRSINRRGAEVERSEARRVESNVSATAHRRNSGFGASVPRARSNVTDTAKISEERASERCARELARAPARWSAVGRCWC